MPPLEQLPFGKRRWIFFGTGLLGGVAAIGAVGFFIAQTPHLAGGRTEILLALAVVAGIITVAGLAMWLPWTLWKRRLLRRYVDAIAAGDRVRAERAIVSLARIEAHTQMTVAWIWTLQLQTWAAFDDWSTARVSIDACNLEALRASGDPVGGAFAAVTFAHTGDVERALELIEPIAAGARDKGRNGAMARAAYGIALFHARRFGEAIEQLTTAIAARPTLLVRHAVFALAEALLAEGRHQEVHAVLAPIVEKSTQARVRERAAELLKQARGAYR